MSRERPIPKPLFQAVALVALVVAWPGSLWLAWARVGPLAWLVDTIGMPLSLFVAWVVGSLVWMIVMLPLRLMTRGFATLEQSFSATGTTNLVDAVAFGVLTARPADGSALRADGSRAGREPIFQLQAERERLERMSGGTPAERRRYRLNMALGGLVVALATGVGTALNIALGGDLFLVFPLVCLTALGLSAWNALWALASR